MRFDGSTPARNETTKLTRPRARAEAAPEAASGAAGAAGATTTAAAAAAAGTTNVPGRRSVAWLYDALSVERKAEQAKSAGVGFGRSSSAYDERRTRLTADFKFQMSNFILQRQPPRSDHGRRREQEDRNEVYPRWRRRRQRRRQRPQQRRRRRPRPPADTSPQRCLCDGRRREQAGREEQQDVQ